MGATVYYLDSTTIDLCLSLFSRMQLRTIKAAIKLHTLMDLRGTIPSFIHIRDGKMHDVKVLGRDAKACDKKFVWRIHAPHLLTYENGDKQ